MKNFYRLIQGDCLKVLPTLKEENIDLVITDPPYGFANFGDWTEQQAKIFWEQFIKQLHKPMKKGASFYSFCGWKWYVEARQAVSHRLKYLKTLIWDKRTFIGTRGDISTLTYHNISEPILLAYKLGRRLTFNLEDVRIPTIHGDPRSNPKGKRPGDILSCIALRNNAREKLEHKGQKPSKLIKTFVKASSNKSEIILDPFLGSGTTMKVAQDLNRSCIGIEIDPNYCEIVKKRCFGRNFLDRKVEYDFKLVEAER